MSNTNPNIVSEPNKTGGSKRSFYIILIILLILANVSLIFLHMQANKKNDELELKRKEADSTLAVVNTELQSKIAEYQQLMGENATLDSTLKSNIAQLQGKQAQIDKLLKEKNFNSAQYKSALEEIAALRKEKEQFSARIDSLSSALKYMTQVNDSLNTSLKGKIAEGEQLKNEKQELSKKVAVGSLLKPNNIKVTGVKFTGKNSKEVEINKAKKIEKLKICFDVPDNQVADAGQKTLLICLIGPDQTTIAIESEGSGIFVASNGEQKQYTTKATFDYDNTKKTLCVYWKQSNPFAAGNYKVQFYQDNISTGEGTFILK